MNDIEVKIALIGDNNVGKSCIRTQFCQNYFDETYQNTIGLDFCKKTITLFGINFSCSLYDCDSHCAFHSQVFKVLKKVHAFLIVFDKTDPNAFKNLEYWLDFIEEVGSGTDSFIDPLKFLVGNKTDLESSISYDEGRERALVYDLIYIETSAKYDRLTRNVFEILLMKQLINYKIALDNSA